MTLPFDPAEYDDRLIGLRDLIEMHGLDAVVLTSARNLAYYAGYLPDDPAPAACVVTAGGMITLAPEAGAACHGDRAVPQGTGRDGLWRAIAGVTGTGRAIGCEADHLTMVQADMLNGILRPKRGMDVSPATMAQRLVKSEAEQAVMRRAAAVADAGAGALRDAAARGATGPDAARAAMQAMQDGQGQGGASGLVARARMGNVRPGQAVTMVLAVSLHGYVVPLTRTLVRGAADTADAAVWADAVARRAAGLSLLVPGAACGAVGAALDAGAPARHGGAIGLCLPGDMPDHGLDLRDGVDAVLETGMTLDLLTRRAGVTVEQDPVLITDEGAETLCATGCGPDHWIV